MTALPSPSRLKVLAWVGLTCQFEAAFTGKSFAPTVAMVLGVAGTTLMPCASMGSAAIKATTKGFRLPPYLSPCARPPEGAMETWERPGVSLRVKHGASAVLCVREELRFMMACGVFVSVRSELPA